MQLSLLIKKFKNIHFLSLMSTGGTVAINMLITAVLYRSLPFADNGTWIFYQTTVLFIDTFRTGLLNTAFVKFYSGTSKERGEEVIGSTWFLASAITVLFVVLNLPALYFLPQIKNEGLCLFVEFLSINLIITIPNIVSLCIAQGALQFDRVLYIRLINNGLFLVFVVLLPFFGEVTLLKVVYANLVAVLIANLISLVAGWSEIGLFNKKTFACVRELFHFGKYTVGTSISANLFKVTDTFMINFLLGPAALSIYNLGQKLIEIVEFPLRSLTVTAMPQMSAAYNQNEKSEVIYLMKKYVGVLTLLLIPAFLFAFLFSDYAILFVGGKEYVGTEAANVFRIFMTFALLFPLDRFLAVGLDVIHKPEINFYKVLIMLVINLVADYIGVYILGNVYGIAIASLFPTLFAVAVGYFAIRKYYMPYQFWNAYSVGLDEIKSQTIKIFRRRSESVSNNEFMGRTN